MVGRTRYGVTRHPPPPGPDDLIDRELTPHVGSCDDVVEPGVRYEDHVGGRAGRDGGERPAGAWRQQVRHIPGPFGQIGASRLLQPPDSAAPPARGPVPSLGEDDQRAPLLQAPGQPGDLLGEDVLAGLARLDPHVRQPVAHDVHAGVELQGGLHYHPRPPVVDAEQLMHQQERIPRPGVPAQHDDRPGQPGGQLIAGELGLIHLDPQSVCPLRTPVHGVQEPAHDPVVPALVRLGAQPPAEPAHHPQPGQRDQRHRLGHQPDQGEADQPQAAHVSGPRPRQQAGHQGRQRQERREHDEAERDDDHQRCQHKPPDQPGWDHPPLPSSRPGPGRFLVSVRLALTLRGGFHGYCNTACSTKRTARHLCLATGAAGPAAPRHGPRWPGAGRARPDRCRRRR